MILAKSFSLSMMSFEYSVKSGEISSARACMVESVAASLRLKKIDPIFERVLPEYSSASIVLAKVGASLFATIESI